MRAVWIILISIFSLSHGSAQRSNIDERIKKINELLPSLNSNASNTDLMSKSTIVLKNDGVLRFITTNTRKGKEYDKSEFSISVYEIDKNKLNIKKIECCNILEFYCKDNSFDCVEYIDRTSRQLKPIPYVLMDKNWKNNQHVIFNLERLIEEIQTNGSGGTPMQKKTEVVQLYKNGGVYLVNLKLGSKSATAILDSGASVVSISKRLETELLKDRVINKQDYITPAQYRIANGKIISAKRFILPSLTVGNLKIKNVICSIVNDESPILLGKSFLDQFAKWSIDNDKQTLTLVK